MAEARGRGRPRLASAEMEDGLRDIYRMSGAPHSDRTWRDYWWRDRAINVLRESGTDAALWVTEAGGRSGGFRRQSIMVECGRWPDPVYAAQMAYEAWREDPNWTVKELAQALRARRLKLAHTKNID